MSMPDPFVPNDATWTLQRVPGSSRLVALNCRFTHILDIFREEPGLCGVLVEERDRPVGIITRQSVTRFLCGLRYAALAFRRTARVVMTALDDQVRRLPECCTIDDAVKQALQRPEATRFEPLMVVPVEAAPRLVGVHELLLAESACLSEQMNSARLAAAAATKAEAQYREIFENTIEGIFRTTPQGTYLKANPALARMYGFETAQQLIDNIGDIATQLYVDPLRRSQFMRLMDEHDIVTGFEAEIRTKDGGRRWISENVRAVRAADGELLYYEGTVEDITHRKSQEAYRLAKETAEAANAAKSEFLANISHEIRTPLHGILSFASMGAKRAETSEPRKTVEYFQHIETAGRRLLSLVNDLLDLSKLESGLMSFQMASIDVAAAVGCVHDEFASLLSERGMKVHFNRPPGPIHAVVDAGRLMQVVRNLLHNAVKFSPQYGLIELDLVAEAHRIVIRVRDHGLGVPEAELESIFQKFVQSSRTRSGAGGTGLGLSICRQIVEAHGGTVQAANAPDGGAIFTVSLPLVPATACGQSGGAAA
jgi:PAS domain S-box-containing protein